MTSKRPPIRAAKDALPKAPTGCMSSIQLERWFVTLAKRAAESAELVAKAYPFAPPIAIGAIVVEGLGAPKARDFHDESAIAKHRDNAIKAMRAAAELALRREDDDIVDRRNDSIDARERGASH